MLNEATAAPVFNPWRHTGRLRWAGMLSALLHLGVGALIVGAVVKLPQTAPPIRVSLIDPAPPPPAGAGGVTAAPAAPVAPQPEAARVPDTAPLKPKPVPRIHRATKPVAPRPAPAPAVSAAVPDAGQADGVAGGVPGGIAGGIVGGTGHTLISAEEAARQPILIKKVIPDYPPIARLRGIEGQVLLEVILATDGHVEPEVTVLESVPLLDAAAIAAVRQWRFSPARDRDGEALRVTIRQPVRFVLR